MGCLNRREVGVGDRLRNLNQDCSALVFPVVRFSSPPPCFVFLPSPDCRVPCAVRWLLGGRDVTLFEGEFTDGDFNGLGTFYFENGDVYHGRWKQGLFDGKGEYTASSGQRYDASCRFYRPKPPSLLPTSLLVWCTGVRLIGVFPRHCPSMWYVNVA